MLRQILKEDADNLTAQPGISAQLIVTTILFFLMIISQAKAMLKILMLFLG